MRVRKRLHRSSNVIHILPVHHRIDELVWSAGGLNRDLGEILCVPATP